MITNKKYKWSIALATIFFTATIGSHAIAKNQKFCAYLDAEFIDGGGNGKEDYFNSQAIAAYPARYAYLTLTKVGDTSPMWDDYLDGEGCTEMRNFEASTEYEAELVARVSKEGNRTISIPRDGDDGCGYWCETRDYEIPGSFVTRSTLESALGDQMKWNPGIKDPKTNLLLLAGWLLYRSDDLGYPANTGTVIKTDGQNDCDQGAWGGAFNWNDGEICVNSTITNPNNRHAMTAGAYFKFVVGHELGHRVQYANGKSRPVGGNYAGYISGDRWVHDMNAPANMNNADICTCNLVVEEDGSPAHCFQSREPIQDAMGEGFGHFYASAMFNERPADGAEIDHEDCWFAYPKQGWVWYYLGWDTTFLGPQTTTPVFHRCASVRPGAHPSFPDVQFPFMDTMCNPGNEDVGIERDWLSLFWRLYINDLGAPGDNRFSMTDILKVFGSGNGDYHFQKSLDAVIAEWENNNLAKVENFVSHAINEGVDHCSNGCDFHGYDN